MSVNQIRGKSYRLEIKLQRYKMKYKKILNKLYCKKENNVEANIFCFWLWKWVSERLGIKLNFYLLLSKYFKLINFSHSAKIIIRKLTFNS